MERWLSGLKRRFAKPLYGVKSVPRVRIPPFPHIETSRFERVAPRGREAAALRKMARCEAANWLAGQKSKTADLSLFHI